MSELTVALGIAAPWYNLFLVLIVVIMFIHLFRVYRKTRIGHIKPWALIFLAVMVYIAEEVFTVLRDLRVFHLPYHVNGYFEFGIIVLFIYALLVEREQIKLEETVAKIGLPIKKVSGKKKK